MDSNDSTFEGLMFSADSAKEFEAWGFIGMTSVEGEPAADESVALLFDPVIWRNETK